MLSAEVPPPTSAGSGGGNGTVDVVWAVEGSADVVVDEGAAPDVDGVVEVLAAVLVEVLVEVLGVEVEAGASGPL